MNPNRFQPQPQQPQEDYGMDMMGMPNYASSEAEVTNIVGQIDPQTIIDNLDHALKGEQWDKEQQKWVMNASLKPLVNDECRGAIVSYLSGMLNNNTTMANISEKRLSHFMESVIESISKMFIVNLERFGFVPKGVDFDKEIYYNRGSPDTARMTLVANKIYVVCFNVFSRALEGSESRRIFKSLTMSDGMGGGMQGTEKKSGWVGKLFGR